MNMHGNVRFAHLVTAILAAALLVMAFPPVETASADAMQQVGVLAKVVNTDRLNVRSGPSPAYRAIRGLRFGDVVALVGRNENGSWVQLASDGGRQEWVNSYYVQTFDFYDMMLLPVTSATTPTTPPSSATDIKANVVNANRANVRSGPSEAHGVVRQLPYGQEVVLIGRNVNGTWVQLQNPHGRAEWIYNNLVQAQGNANIMSLPVTSNTYGGTTGSQPSTGVRVHVVQAGETLGTIARRYGTTIGVLAALNGLSNPNFIFVGQRLFVSGSSGYYPAPAPPAQRVHVVQAGENLYRIALHYGVNYWTLAAANGISNPNIIYVGQRLVIP